MSQETAPLAVPYSRETEEALLGAVLVNPEAFQEVQAIISPQDFYIQKHTFIWEAMLALQAQHSPVDMITLPEALTRRGLLEEAGGAAYLARLINGVPNSLNAGTYARLVADHALRRRMIEAANQIARLAYQTGLPVEAAVEISRRLADNLDQAGETHAMQPVKAVLNQMYDQYDETLHASSPAGIRTGFSELDRILGGMQPAEFLVVAGRPGTGKTSFLINVVRFAAGKLGKRVAMFSLEMSGVQIVFRLMAQASGLDGQRLRQARLSDEEVAVFLDRFPEVENLPLFLCEESSLSPLKLRALCQRLQKEQGLDLVVVDYLQLMPGGMPHARTRQEEVANISRELKALAKELDVPVLAAAQLSRAVEQRADKHPLLSDLRESGSIEQDSDAVILLYRPEGGQSRLVDVELAKNRNGPAGRFQLIFEPAQACFHNAAGQGGE